MPELKQIQGNVVVSITKSVLLMASLIPMVIAMDNRTLLSTSSPTDIQHQSTPNTTYDIAKEVFVVKFLIVFLYSVIAFVGLAGNLLVVWVVVRTKSLQTITNIFIANLAVSDILMSVVATPFTPLSLYMVNWTLPEAVCKLLPITMGVSVYVSTLTSMAIALDRFFVIVHPFLPRMRIWLCIIIIFTVWVIAVLISMPLAVYQQKHKDPLTNVSACRENWPKESSREVFTIVSFVLQFVVPCSIIMVCYFRISLILRMRLKTKIGSGTKSQLREEHEIRRKRRTNTMLIAMVIIFVICWIPLNILWMVMDVSSEEQAYANRNSTNFSLIFFICHLLAMSSAVYNPFLYAWMNDNFRKEFRQIIPCLFRQPCPTNDINAGPPTGVEYTVGRVQELNTIQPSSSFIQQEFQTNQYNHSTGANDNEILPNNSQLSKPCLNNNNLDSIPYLGPSSQLPRALDTKRGSLSTTSRHSWQNNE